MLVLDKFQGLTFLEVFSPVYLPCLTSNTTFLKKKEIVYMTSFVRAEFAHCAQRNLLTLGWLQVPSSPTFDKGLSYNSPRNKQGNPG